MESWNVVFPEAQRVEVRKEPLDPVLGRTEILCRSVASLISTGTELQCLRGVFDAGTNWSEWVKYPFQPGYLTTAEVLEVGPEVTGVRAGDRVNAAHPHAQYFKAEARDVYLLPKEISAEQGLWLSLAKTTQLGVRRAELQLGETVGVIGLGLLGQLVAQYAYLSGAKELYAIDPAASRLDLLPKLPGIRPLAMDAGAAREEIRAATAGQMLDVVFDVTGHPSVLAQATLLVKPFGRVVLLGDTSVPSQQTLGPNVVSDAVSILGMHSLKNYRDWNHPAMSELFLSYLIQGRMDIGPLITHRYSPLDAPEAYGLLTGDRSSAMGVLFDWTRLA
ncbi:zinc-dependent alcohol dehydrogenase [Cohnella sp. JJ-181]|uniref:zinc-dependent alcohol dehydrogenase n=1 Tax=Cohnella rhizoplanae TaxID=2974897 RepID=UPI0022FF6F58|nr:zinc-binding alcohol dehydrogenase [Cohnella sp. JJ-181]CAI6086796.1 L-threonine 3-dehydrogenase [Cohnella sp. JJ-181]